MYREAEIVLPRGSAAWNLLGLDGTHLGPPNDPSVSTFENLVLKELKSWILR